MKCKLCDSQTTKVGLEVEGDGTSNDFGNEFEQQTDSYCGDWVKAMEECMEVLAVKLFELHKRRLNERNE